MPRLQEATRRKIQENIEAAALHLLATRGYESTGMRDVADAAGMSAAALYNHYKSKEQLFAAVVGSYKARLADEDSPLVAYLKTCRFPWDLPELAAAIERVVLRDRHFLILWYIDLLTFSGRHFKKQLAPTVLAERDELRRRFLELEEEEVLAEEAAFAFNLVYIHLFNFFLVEHVFGRGNSFGLSTDKALKRVIAVLRRGILRSG